MAFKKGDPKPATSGRKKGQTNWNIRSARERLADNGCNIDLALANAIMSKDIAMIEALAKLLGYYTPKYSDQAPPAAAPTSDEQAGDSDDATVLQMLTHG